MIPGRLLGLLVLLVLLALVIVNPIVVTTRAMGGKGCHGGQGEDHWGHVHGLLQYFSSRGLHFGHGLSLHSLRSAPEKPLPSQAPEDSAAGIVQRWLPHRLLPSWSRPQSLPLVDALCLPV